MDNSLQAPLNPAQVEILKLFSQGLSTEQTDELRKLLIAFRFKLLNEHVERVAAQKGLTLDEINEVSKQHKRTAYRSKQENTSPTKGNGK